MAQPPSFKLPRLVPAAALVDAQGKPTGTFMQWWQQVVTRLEDAITRIVQLAGIQDQFYTALQQAQQAAQDAQDAADMAQATTNAAKREAALQGSYIEPDSVLTATPDTITIAAHTRYYADGTNAAVSGGTVPTTGPGDSDYVSYSDPTRGGGAVTFIASTSVPVQTGDTHVVGAIVVPSTGSSTGGRGPLKPGYVSPTPFEP